MAEPPQLSVKREFNMNKPHAVPKERNSIGGKVVNLCVRKNETKKEREKERERGQLSCKYEINMNQPHPISMERNRKKVRF